MKLIISTTKNGVIGLNGLMLWNFRSDIERYKKITNKDKGGSILIMGNTTYKSLRQKRIKNHINIVLTTKPKNNLVFDEINGLTHVYFVQSVEQAIEVCKEINNFNFAQHLPDKEIFVIGGAKTFKQFEQHIDTIYHTIVDKTFYDNFEYTKYNLDLRNFKLVHTENISASNNENKTEFKIYVKN